MGKLKIIQTSVALSLVLNNFTDVAILAHTANEMLESETDTSSVPGVPDMETTDTGQESESADEVQTPSTEGEAVGNEESETPSTEGETVGNGESETPSINQEVTNVEPSEDETQDEQTNDLENPDELESQDVELQPRASGSGLVQLWQVVPSGQTQEGKTTSEIMQNLQCKPNHNLYPLNGEAQQETYVNSCYVDDALYLGEDANYYYIYLSGYEGKVPKSQSHYFDLDLNNDGKNVKYEIQTVAYYIPDSGARSLPDEGTYQDAPELKYNTDYLDKDEEEGIALYASNSVQSPSYYANEGGTLYHYLTNNVTKANNYSKVTVGKAPSFMSENVKYYSYDGVYFYTDWRQIDVDGVGAINQNNPFYNYYQYLPFRSKTNYNANAFDTYTVNNGGAGGKLVGAGQYFYAVGDRFGINGALQYAMGIHESGWGKSSLSMNKNNLFGMNATDNNPYGNGTSFPTVEAGINYHADRYISWGYTDPISDWRYFGSHVGNKGSGMNVKYASDPFWGEKIAGWYYRFDQANGLKDYNYYSIGIKSSNDVVDVKSDATSNAKTYYQTKNKKSNLTFGNYPVLITGEKNGYYRIQTDTPIVNGAPSYSATYNWATSVGYIPKDAIDYVNKRQTGWIKDSGNWYYYKDGQMQTGWQKVDNEWYYLDSEGRMKTGWLKLDNKWYYLNSSGKMQTGWLQLDNKKYYLDANGIMQTGWQKLDNKWYYFYESGAMAKGWIERPDGWYYTDNTGVMQLGWQTVEGKKYYFNSIGKMQIGWQKIDNKWYYFYESGSMVKGWVERPDGWYYTNTEGIMQTGWQTIGGKRYYFYSSGLMAVNTVIDGYTIDANGVAN